jgi:hypothetical protein
MIYQVQFLHKLKICGILETAMNKLVLVLFIVVLTLTLGVVIFYFYSISQKSSAPQKLSPSPVSQSGVNFAEAKLQAAKDCRKVGSTFAEVKDYLDNLFKKTSWREDGVDIFSIIDIGDSCWGIVIAGSEGEGNFYYENGQNNLITQKIYQFSL